MKSINAVSQKVDYKKFYTSPWGMVFIAYFVAMGLVGAFTPADILKANPWARDFCDFMASYVSQIDKVTALNIEPDINRFYFSVMWAGSPFVLVSTLASSWFTRGLYISDTSVFWRLQFFEGLLRLIVALVFVILIGYFFFHFANDSSSRALQGLLRTSIGRAIAAQWFVHGLPMMLGILVMFSIGWLTGYIPRNIKKQNELEQLNN